MASPGYLKMFDENNQPIRGNVKIQGRQGAAEVLGFNYQVSVPSDPNTGALTAVRKHGDAIITKTYDSASPILFDACCRGKTLQTMEIDWYRINDHGEEEIYFAHKLSEVKVVRVKQFVLNVKDPGNDMFGHQEEIHLRFRRIDLMHPEGSIHAYDEWTEARGRKGFV